MPPDVCFVSKRTFIRMTPAATNRRVLDRAAMSVILLMVYSSLPEHDLFRKPVPTFRDHALIPEHDLFRKPVPTFRDYAFLSMIFSENRLPLFRDYAFLSMIFSENRFPLFGIMHSSA